MVKLLTAGVFQGSVLGPLLFFIYINDLTDVLTSIVKLFADDTSLFGVTHDISASTKEHNEDFNKINNWAFQRKINFNPDRSKQKSKTIYSVENYIK